MVTGVVPPLPRFLPSIFIAHRVQQSHCSSIFHRVLLTHAVALSASPFVHKKKSPRMYTSIHSGGFELTKLTYTRLEDNLIRHRGDRQYVRNMYKDRALGGPALHNSCAKRTCLREGGGNGPHQEVECHMHLQHMTLEIVGFVGSGFARRHM